MELGRTEAAHSLVAGNIVAEAGNQELGLVEAGNQEPGLVEAGNQELGLAEAGSLELGIAEEDIRGKLVVEGIEVLVDSLERSR